MPKSRKKTRQAPDLKLHEKTTQQMIQKQTNKPDVEDNMRKNRTH